MSKRPTEALAEHERNCLAEGITLIHRGEFFEAHEVIESAWTGCRSTNRRFLQAIIHVAVGCHHQAQDNPIGMRRQFRKAVTKLLEYPAGHCGIETPSLVELLRQAIERAPEDAWNPREIRLRQPEVGKRD